MVVQADTPVRIDGHARLRRCAGRKKDTKGQQFLFLR